MKKRVKVYRAENGQGAYVNNLAKFMQKAQMGGEPSMDQMSYPGAQQSQEMDENQVINMIAMDITSGKPKEETMAKLTNIVGLDFQTADQFFENVRTQVNSRKTEVEEESVEEESTPPDPSGNQETVETEEEEGPSNNDIAYQDALNDDSDEAVMEGDIEGMYQMGGDVTEDFGNEYPVTLPDVSAYLPSDMYNFWDPTNPAAQVAWNPNMGNPTAQQEVDNSYTDMPEATEMAKYGGYKNVKKTYVNAILRANRRQTGGDAVSEESNADSTGQNYRTAKLKGFVGTLKNNATESLLKEQASQEFDQMLQMGGMEQDVENPMHHLEALSNATGNVFDEQMNQVNMAQRGGFMQRLRNRNQQAQVPNMNFFQNKGFMNAGMPIESIDVRKSGRLFGRPKEYSVTFGPPTLPGGANGVYPGAFYGYGSPGVTTEKKKVVTKGTIIDEAAKTVNQEASKEVAKTTPGSEAAQTSAEGTKQTENTVTTNTGGGGNAATTTTTTETNQPVKPVIKPKPTAPTTKKDKWGRPEGDQWYGFNPQTKKYEEGPKAKPTAPTTPAPATPKVQRDQWGRAKGSKYYGFNPETGKYEQGTAEKQWTTKSGNQATSFEGTYNTGWAPMSGNFGSSKNARYQIVRDKNGKIIPSKSFAAVEQSPDYGGTIYVPWNEIPDISTNTAEDSWNTGLGGDMIENQFGGATFQGGGSVNDLTPDPFGNLQQFVYGGDEYINQADMDYSDSKDVTDPYFQYGGVNQITGITDKQGQQIQNYVRPQGSYIKDITVNKTGILGRPKQYSVTFSGANDPRTPQFSLNTPTNNQSVGTSRVPNEDLINKSDSTQSDRTDTTGLSGRASRQIRQGERKIARQTARGEREFGTAEEQAQEYERANPMESMAALPQMKRVLSSAQQSEAIPTNKMPTSVDPYKRDFVGAMRTPAFDQASYIQKEYGDIYPEIKDYYDQNAVDASPEEAAQRIEAALARRNSALGFEDPSRYVDENKDDYYDYRTGSRTSQGWNLKNIPDFEPLMSKDQKAANERGMQRNPMMFAYGGYFQNGGGFVGANPVVYTDNPALVGQSDVDMITLNQGIQGQGQTNWADLVSPGSVTQQNNDGTRSYGMDATYKGKQPTQYTVDPTQQEDYQIGKTLDPGDVTVDIRNRRSNEQIEAGLNVANAGIRGITGFKNRMDDAKIARGFYDNFTADNLYASDPSRDRGDYSEAGLHRPDEQGQTWFGRSKQYGGDTNFGEDPDYVEGDEVYMTDDEIRQYMANGGQVEYL